MDEGKAPMIELLQQALDLPPADRSAFVERECGADSKLLTRMHALLANDVRDWDLLDQPVDELAARVFPDEDSDLAGVAGQQRTGSEPVLNCKRP